MELRALRYFLATVQQENISRAAEVMRVTQPALSRQIARLEKELGVVLFKRGRPLELTDAGVMLRRRAEEVTSLVGKIEAEFTRRQELGGVISIGSGGLRANRILPPLLSGFRESHPKIEFDLYMNSAEHTVERLEQGLLDFGILLEPVDITKFDYVRLKHRERWGLLLWRDHPLAAKERVTKEDLAGLPLTCSRRPAIRKELESWLGDSLDSLDIFATHNLIPIAAQLVDGRVAAALTIEGAVDLFAADRLVFRPLFPELAMTSVLVWKKNQPVFSPAGVFLRYLKDML